ncbi:MAG: tetratricopeptide repeat protein [Chitinophagaceae bacterium]|jgi:tetratricopeptide (TPR) repeat protein|nr:tetratricopeptide repeat protein [Chitinophagaceae bacterium]
MSDKKNIQVEEVVDDSAKVVARAKGFWERFSKPITYVGAAIILVFGGYIAYKKLYVEPQESKAADAIWHAQQYFQQDSLALALNGDGQFPGFEKVAKTYGGTKAGNLAGFYAGVCALRLADYKKAESYLKDFSTDSKEIQAIAYARLADTYAELGKKAEAVELYAKAGRHYPQQQALSAENLFRAGLLAEILGKNEDAIKYYKEIKEKYSRTDRGYQIDKYLARLGAVE